MANVAATAHPGTALGIQHVSTWIAEDRIDNRPRAPQFGVDEKFLERRTGMLELAVKRPEHDTSDLAVFAFEKLCQETGIASADVDCLILCTQNPDDHGLPHTSAIVHGKLGLPAHVACFDISLGCSGYVYSLSAIQGFMAVAGLRCGVLITADPYSKIIDMQDKGTSLLFGDAATASLITASPQWRLGRPVFGTAGEQWKAIRTRGEDRLFEMNGRAVVDFCAKAVPENIHAVLAANDLALADIDRILAHQGSRYIIELLVRRLAIESDRLPFVCADYGNTVSSSIPIMLAEEKSADTVLITGFGVGVSWGANVLWRCS